MVKTITAGAVFFAVGTALIWYMVTLAAIEPYTVERDVQAMLWTPAGFVGVAWLAGFAGWLAWLTESREGEGK